MKKILFVLYVFLTCGYISCSSANWLLFGTPLPNPDERKFNKAVNLELKGKYEESLSLYEEVLKKEPGFLGAWINKGGLLGKMKRYNEALKSLDEALRIQPGNSLALNNKGLCYDLMGNYEEAIIFYDKAINSVKKWQEWRNFLNPFFNKANLLVGKGLFEEALRCYDDALKISEEYDFEPEMFYQKGLLLKDLGRDTEAKECFEKANIYFDKDFKNFQIKTSNNF